MITAIKEKAVSILIVALLLSAGFIAWNHSQDQNKLIAEQVTTLGKKDAEIKRLEERVEKDADFNVLQRDTERAVSEVSKKATASSTQAKSYIDERLAAIEKRYSTLPATEQNKKARDMDVSLEQVRGLWAVYCIQALTDPVCK